MQLPATASFTLPSAFDCVGGECSAGPASDRPTIDLARSDRAYEPFDDLLTDALGGAEGLAFLGISPTPATVAPQIVSPAAVDQVHSVAAGPDASSTSDVATNRGATNLRQLVLGGPRPPHGDESASASSPAIAAAAGSIAATTDVRSADAPTDPAISNGQGSSTTRTAPGTIDGRSEVASGDASPGLTANVAPPAEQADHRRAPVSTIATDEAPEPVILSLDEGRRQIAGADTEAVVRRTSPALDESTRAQRLPFAPIVGQSGPTADANSAAAAATESQPFASQPAGSDDQLAASPNPTAGPALPENEHPDESTTEPAAGVANASAPADLDAGPTLVPVDVPSMTVEAAMASGAVVSMHVQPAARDDASSNRTVSPAGGIGRRGPDVRTAPARSMDDAAHTSSDTAIGAQAVAAARSGRSRPDVVTAIRDAGDADTGDDLDPPALTSATSASADSTPLTDPAATEPSVVQQVSQAVETWRDALQEQGSARFAAWLSPPDLGHVFVELTRSGEGITARLKASDDSVQSLLESQEPELRQALSDSGISVAELDLSGKPTGDFSSDHRHQPPERHDDAETSALKFAGPVRRGNSSQRASAIDVRA